MNSVPTSSLQLSEIEFPGVEQRVLCDVSQGRPRVWVPETRRKRIFDAIQCLSHPSGRTMLTIIAKSYVWPSMRKDVLTWARQCNSCATSKIAQHTSPPIRPIETPQERFTHIHVDIMGPLPEDRGFKYLLTMIDRTTRWPEAVPITDTTADTVVRTFLEARVARYGIPITVTSDRGTQFTSEVWKTSLARLGVNVSATTSYHPQANSLVERYHRTLKNALRCATRASSSWTRSLPWVLLCLRNAPRQDTSSSTAEIVFRVPQRIPGRCFQAEQSRPRSATEQL